MKKKKKKEVEEVESEKRKRKTDRKKNFSPTTLAHQHRLVPHPCQTCCVVCGSTRMGRWPGALCAAETAGEAVDGEKGDGGIIVIVVVVVASFARPPSGQGRPTIGKRGPIAMRDAVRERKGSVDGRAEEERGEQCAETKNKKKKRWKSKERPRPRRPLSFHLHHLHLPAFPPPPPLPWQKEIAHLVGFEPTTSWLQPRKESSSTKRRILGARSQAR